MVCTVDGNIYGINPGDQFSPKKTTLEHTRQTSKACGSPQTIPGRKTALSTPVRHSGLVKIWGIFPGKKPTLGTPVGNSGLPKNLRALFPGETALSTPAHWYMLLAFLAEPLQGITPMCQRYAQKTKSLRPEDQPPPLNIFGKRWDPYTPSWTRFSNGLEYNRSNFPGTWTATKRFHYLFEI